MLGQLLIIGFEGTEMSPSLRRLLSDIQPAGVILFARNIVSAPQTRQLLLDCQACCRQPLFLCVDMEGGTVDRLKDVLGPSPSAAQVFQCNDRRLHRKHGRLIGDCCRALGFNVDFAPVVDLASQPSREVMASRVVSPDPGRTTSYAGDFLAGLKAAKVLGCLKHFPGLGEADLDTHKDLPSVDKVWPELWATDLYPYRKFAREAPFVMVAHARYPSVDSLPASLSKKWIGGVLREKIGYRGLVVCDDLEMGGVLAAAAADEAAVTHIRAGGDLCLVCHQEDFVRRVHGGLQEASKKGRRFRALAEQRVARVLRFKSRRPELRRGFPKLTPAKVASLSRTLWEFGERVRYCSGSPGDET